MSVFSQPILPDFPSLKCTENLQEISVDGWNEENVPQVLKHRCAYLNNSL